MCGLAGFVSLNSAKPTRPAVLGLFMTLFILAQLRGTDASGLAVFWKQYGKEGKKLSTRRGWAVEKGLTSPVQTANLISNGLQMRYVNDKEIKHRYDAPYTTAAIGHCRSATQGSVTKQNAHPFSFGNNRFIGVHNGTIYNARYVYRSLSANDPKPNTTPPPADYSREDNDITDSEIVLYCIYRWGIEAVCKKITGAWAFVWWEQETGCLNFLRNSQRPLWYSWSPSDDALFWVSEESMMAYAMQRTTYKTEYNSKKYEEFTPNYWYTLDLSKVLELPYTIKEFPWTSKKWVSLTEHTHNPQVYVGGYTAWERCRDSYEKAEKDPWKSSSVVIPPKDNDPIDAVVRLKYSHIQRKLIPINEWQDEQAKLYKTEPPTLQELDAPGSLAEECSCCVWCGQPLTAARMKGSLSVHSIGHVCGECASDVVQVEQICDFYVETSQDMAWINKYCELAGIRKDKANEKMLMEDRQ